MNALPLDDVARLIRLLAEAGDPLAEIDVPDRRRKLVAGLAEMIGADIWLWATGVASTADAAQDAMPMSVIDGGWEDDAERLRFLRLITDPTKTEIMQGGIIRRQANQQTVTLSPQEIVHPDHQQAGLDCWAEAGLGDCMIGLYPVGPNVYSGIGLHRRRGRPPFTERERAIVQLVIEQVDWLHHYGTEVEASKKVLRLTGRQRQVLLLLMGGDSQRQIALKMQLSEHTVGDYIKEIYRRFGVNSRGELFAHFISGGMTSS